MTTITRSDLRIGLDACPGGLDAVFGPIAQELPLNMESLTTAASAGADLEFLLDELAWAGYLPDDAQRFIDGWTRTEREYACWGVYKEFPDKPATATERIQRRRAYRDATRAWNLAIVRVGGEAILAALRRMIDNVR